MTITALSLSWCYTESGQGGLQFTVITITPLSLSWCYTEFGQGRGTLRSNPLSLSWCYTELGASGLGDDPVQCVS